jgi:hypothetical protein
VAIAWFNQAVFGVIVICEQEEALTVGVQPADGINTFGERTEITQSLSSRIIRKLRKDAVWFVEDDVCVKL